MEWQKHYGREEARAQALAQQHWPEVFVAHVADMIMAMLIRRATLGV